MQPIQIANLITVLLLVASASPLRAYEETLVEKGGSISGIVAFEGTPPPRRPLDVKAPCENHNALSEELVVSKVDGKQFLVNAVVSVVGIEKGKPLSKEPPVLDQKDCVFAPHVVVVPAGAELRINNSDDCNHNVHTHSDLNKESNKAMGPKSHAITHFAEAERIDVRCDMHTWMKAWIVVVDGPYSAVIGDDGAFKIDKIPPGKYKLNVWHETLGEQTKDFEVKPGEETKIDFVFKSK